jgi:hypothetical protein
MLVLSSSWAWEYIPTTTNGAFDSAEYLTVDSDANIFAVGFIGGNAVIVKLNGTTGKEIWRWTFANSQDRWVQINALKVEPNGDLFAAGTSYDTVSYHDVFVLRLSATTGQSVWEKRIDGDGEDADLGWALALDSAGNAIVAAKTTNTPRTFGYDFTVLKLSGSNGQLLWRYRLLWEQRGSSDSAGIIAVDGGDDVIAAGSIESSGNFQFSIAVVKLSGSDGDEIWRRIIPGGGYFGSITTGMDLDQSGNPIISGTRGFSSGSELLVAKLDRENGMEIWNRSLRGSRSYNNDAAVSSMGLDLNGDIVAVGGIDWAGAVFKFSSSSGEVLWQTAVEGIENQRGFLRKLDLDVEGNAVITGFTQTLETDLDISVIKVSGASGQELWRRTFNGIRNDRDEGTDVVVDRDGDVAATGYISNSDTGFEFIVVKLFGATGEDFPPSAQNLVGSLLQFIATLEVPNGIKESFLAKLNAAVHSAERTGSSKSIINPLRALLEEIKATRGKRLGVPAADALARQVEQAITRLEYL